MSPLPLGQNQSKVGTDCSCSLWPPWTWPSVPFWLLWSHSHPSRARRRLLPRDREALAPACQSGRLELEQRSQSSQPGWGLRRLPCMKSLPVNPGITAGGGCCLGLPAVLLRARFRKEAFAAWITAAQGLQGPETKCSLAPGTWRRCSLEPLLAFLCVCSILQTHFLHSLLGGQPWLPQLCCAFWSQPHPSHLVGSSSLPLMPAFVCTESRALWNTAASRLGARGAFLASVCLSHSLVSTSETSTLTLHWDPLPADQSLI